MAIKLQVRRDTANNWAISNPYILPGEIGFETDTGKIKIGREAPQNWNELQYISTILPDHTHNITDINNFNQNVQAEILSFIVDGTDITTSYDAQTDKLSFLYPNFNANVQTEVLSFIENSTDIIKEYDALSNKLSFKLVNAVGGNSKVTVKTANTWSTENPVLLEGEVGYESDTNKLKIGTVGDLVWNLSDYIRATVGIADINAIGTPSSTTYLRGDGVWSAVSGGTTQTTETVSFYKKHVVGWGNNAEINITHRTEDNNSRLVNVQTITATSVIDNTWDFNEPDNNEWVGGTITNNSLFPDTKPGTVVSTDASNIIRKDWTNISSIDTYSSEDDLSVVFLNPSEETVNASGFTDEVSGSYLMSNLSSGAEGGLKLTNSYSMFGGTSVTGFSTTHQLYAIVNGLSDIGTGDFTVDLYFRVSTTPASSTYYYLISLSANAIFLYLYNGRIYYSGGSVVFTFNSGTFYYIRLERYNGTSNLYINGNKVSSIAWTGNVTYIDSYIGNRNSAANPLTIGYIDEVRVSNIARSQGVASFTVPTGPFTVDANTLFLCHFEGNNNDTPPYRHNCRVGKKCYSSDLNRDGLSWKPNIDTSGAFIFSGISTGPALYTYSCFFGTSDYTYDLWFYLPSTISGDGAAFFDTRNLGGTLLLCVMGTDGGASTANAGKLCVFIGTTATYFGEKVSIQEWHHAAFVRISGTYYVYMDGILLGSLYSATAQNNIGAVIGNDSLNFQYSFLLKQVRITRGALWTTNFTPPDRHSVYPITPDTITLLNGQTNKTNREKLTPTSPSVNIIKDSLNDDSTSMTGKYLIAYADEHTKPVVGTKYSLNNTDFTIEAVFRRFPEFTALSATKNILVSKNTSTTTSSYYLAFNSTSFGVYFGSTLYASIPLTSIPNISDGQWHHVAFVRTGNNIVGFFDGISISTTNVTAQPASASDPSIWVGTYLDKTSPTIAHIAFARVVYRALYVDNFTPIHLQPLPYERLETTSTIRVLVSFDNRNTWKTFDGLIWSNVSVGNILSAGMTLSAFKAIPYNKWAEVFLIAGTRMDIAIYMDDAEVGYAPFIERITFNVTSNIASDLPQSSYSVSLLRKNTIVKQTSGATINDAYITIILPDNVVKTMAEQLGDSNEIIHYHDSETDITTFTLADTIASNKHITGTWTFKNTAIDKTDLGNVSGAASLNLSLSSYFIVTIVGNTTLSITNPVTGSVTQNLIIKIINGGAYTVSWPTSFKWDSGAAPTLTTSGTDLFTFISDDNGTTWINTGRSINTHS
jgi:hypothetical protein